MTLGNSEQRKSENRKSENRKSENRNRENRNREVPPADHVNCRFAQPKADLERFSVSELARF